jgi:hypothetical protein
MSKQSIIGKLIDFFQNDSWEFQRVPDAPVLTMGFKGMNGQWVCYAQARESEEQFVFYSVLPVAVPEAQRQKFAEFSTRANYGMVIGNFEMDFEDGEIRYKTSVDIEGSQLTEPMIRQLVYANLVITDQYLPGVMRVIYSDETVVEILANLEQFDDFPEELLDGLDFLDDEPPTSNGNLPN